MKKIILLTLCFTAFLLHAQTNFQIHYDFGKERRYVTSTMEMFKSNKWGNTFWFVGIDYNGGKNRYLSMAYMDTLSEILGCAFLFSNRIQWRA